MAQVIQSTFVVTISKLVKDTETATSVLDADQTITIQQMLPGVVEEVLGDSSVIVEVQSISD